MKLNFVKTITAMLLLVFSWQVISITINSIDAGASVFENFDVEEDSSEDKDEESKQEKDIYIGLDYFLAFTTLHSRYHCFEKNIFIASPVLDISVPPPDFLSFLISI